MKVVVLGMGGTIAGVADASAPRGYRAGEVSVGALAEQAGVPAGVELVTEQVAQVDSKDMDAPLWLALARRARHWLAQPDVAGVVVTHGTDTLEETAFFLHLVMDAPKPLVLTGAMRPATHAEPDGPGNLRDAIAVAAWPGARGVLAVFAGRVFAGSEVRKVHPTRVDAFEAGDAGDMGNAENRGPVARIVRPGLELLRDWPAAPAEPLPHALERLEQCLAAGRPLPWVAWVTSHADASGEEVRALLAAGVQGLVVAGTGHSMVHRRLEAALAEAREKGVPVWIGSRCSLGDAQPLEAAPLDRFVDPALAPAKARILLQLKLLQA